MIEKIFYNVFILGTIISLFVLPILIFLAKNKYKYNFKSIYKIFVVILLLLMIPINSLNFSKIKETFIRNRMSKPENIDMVDLALEDSHFEFQNENLIIEFDSNINNTINVKNDTFFNLFNIASYVWFSIAVLLIIYNVFNYLLFLCKLKSHTNSKNYIIDNAISEISKIIGLKKKVLYEISDRITTPMTIGILRKKIILPIKTIESNEYEVILKHELFHIKNNDIEYKFLLLLLNCIYWFNPIIYNFVDQVDEIMELNCDEKVLENKEDSYRVQYAKILLNQIEQNRNKEYSFSMNFANRRKNIMNRFSSIVNKQKKKSTITLAGILTTLVILMLTAVICVPNINFATIEENIKNEENEIATENTANVVDVENKVEEPELVAEEETPSELTEQEDTSGESEPQLVPATTESTASENIEEPKINTSKRMDETSKSVPDGINFELPIKDDYTLVARFGKSEYAETATHIGVDLKAQDGNNIYAVENGTVAFSGWKGSYGYLIVIQHNDTLQTYYAHCSELLVQKGQTVEKGQVIAKVGSTGNSTGPHLHLEVRENGIAVNPANYLTF